MPINTGNFAKALQEGVEGWYGLSYNEYAEQCKEVFETRTSRKAFEEIVGTSALGMAAVKPEGSSVNYDAAQETFTARYAHETLALAFSIDNSR